MKNPIHLPSLFISLTIASVIGLILHLLSGLGWWTSFAIGFVAMLINGIIATVEDNAPDGFNNPKPNEDEKLPKQ